MESLNAFSLVFSAAFHIIEPFAAIGLLALGYWAVAELQRHGYRATYGAAIVRAMGAGVLAAQDKGLDPFGSGRSLVLRTGAAYLASHVGDAASGLGITTLADHAQRVEAQLGVVAAQAEVSAQAAAISVGAATSNFAGALEGVAHPEQPST